MEEIIVPYYELTLPQRQIKIPENINYEREFSNLKNSINCPKK